MKGSELDFFVLKKYMVLLKRVKITVLGDSMNPLLKNGDIVDVKEENEYCAGDVIVFLFESRLIVHRLILKYNDIFLCKGDNSYGLEKIKLQQILGKVVHVCTDNIDVPIPKVSKSFIKHSFEVNCEFCSLGYNKEKLQKSKVYVDYKKKYLE